MSQIGDSKETKYIARRLGVFVSMVAMITVAVMWTTIMITVEDLINPPSPQPEGITRIEKMTEECWDILDYRHDGERDALVITIAALCQPDKLRFPRVLAELQYWLEREYQGEQFFLTEWAFKQGRDYFIGEWLICNGLGSVMDLTTVKCTSQFVKIEVPQRVWRRWWVEDFNNWRSK